MHAAVGAHHGVRAGAGEGHAAGDGLQLGRVLDLWTKIEGGKERGQRRRGGQKGDEKGMLQSSQVLFGLCSSV